MKTVEKIKKISPLDIKPLNRPDETYDCQMKDNHLNDYE
jgi:hypothetical protein